MITNELIGANLKIKRESVGLNQSQVAQYLGIQREVISYYESGKRKVSTVLLQKIANIYGCKITDFLQEKIEETPQVSMAFRAASELSQDDLNTIINAKQLLSNIKSLKKL